MEARGHARPGRIEHSLESPKSPASTAEERHQELTERLLIAMVTGCAMEITALPQAGLASLVADAGYLASVLYHGTAKPVKERDD